MYDRDDSDGDGEYDGVDEGDDDGGVDEYDDDDGIVSSQLHLREFINELSVLSTIRLYVLDLLMQSKLSGEECVRERGYTT